MSTPPYPLRPEPLRRGWLEQHPRWKIPAGCLILLLLIGGFAMVVLTAITTSFHNSEVYKQATARATENSQVPAALGEPIQFAWIVSGQLNVNGSTGSANLSIPLSGPRARGTIHAVAYKSGGVWRFAKLDVGIAGKLESIDLLSTQPRSE
jgi:Cytochrome oxidase complex assembly protein 1